MVLTEILLRYKYAIMVPIAFAEGPIVTLTAGFLARLGYFDILPAFACLAFGDYLGDIMWYGIGYRFGTRFIARWGKYFGITEHSIASVKNLFHRHKNSILLASKVTMGFGFALVTLITAGLVKIPFRRFLLLNAGGQVIWTTSLIAIGYFLGNFYITFDNALGKASVVALFIVICFALFGFGKYIRARIGDKSNL